MSSASSQEPYSTGHYRPESFTSQDIDGSSQPPLSLCPEPSDHDCLDTPGSKREESKLVGIYAVVLFSGLILLSGIGVMLSEDIPRWITESQRPITEAAEVPAGSNTFSLTGSPRQFSESPLGNHSDKVQASNAIAFPKLPERFDPVWSQHAFDKTHHPITILTLKKPFKISQTTHNSGLEYFTYNAYLLRQIASQMPDSTVREKLLGMAKLSDTMAVNLEHALQGEFTGTPSANLKHLHAKEYAQQSLQSLNAKPIEIINRDRSGKLIQSLNTADAFKAGSELQAYQDILKDIIHSPLMRQEYPDTTALLISQGNRLQKISQNLSLQWESRFSCLKAICEKEPSNARVSTMHIYVKQNLSDSGV